MLTINIICFTLYALYYASDAAKLITLIKFILIENIALPYVENSRLYNIRVRLLEAMSNAIASVFVC